MQRVINLFITKSLKSCDFIAVRNVVLSTLKAYLAKRSSISKKLHL